MPQVLHPGRYLGKLVGGSDHGAFMLQTTRYAAAEALPAHAHKLPYLCFVLEGGYRERSGPAELDCAAGTVVVHHGGAIHSDCFGTAGGTCLNVAWNGQGGAALVRRSGRPLPTGAWRTPRLAELGAELADAASSRARPKSAFLLERLSEIAEEIAGAEVESGRADEPPWIARVEREIEERLDLDLDVRGLARSAGVHRTTLLRAFRRHRGASVSDVIRARRLERAIRAIASTSVPLAELAHDLGYADQSHLCRTLRAATGTSPARLRRPPRSERDASCVQEGPADSI